MRLEVGDELAQRRRIEHRARQHVRAGLARLLEHGDRQRLAALRLLQLRQAQRRRQPGRAAADDQDVDVEGLAFHRSATVAAASPQPTFCSSAIMRRHDLEQIADDAVVGDLEDRRVGVLVDRDDRARRPSCRPGAGWRRRCRARRRASARRSGRSCRSGAPSAASRRRRSAATRRARRRAPRPAAARAAGAPAP